ncbi:L antigen family member 3-like [Hoplias malabaricus]|uniref:L antigen family member 3-like n=1 Tax=Hoplias malabaricus TaxID=27720 RepID=UPI003462B7A9
MPIFNIQFKERSTLDGVYTFGTLSKTEKKTRTRDTNNRKRHPKASRRGSLEKTIGTRPDFKMASCAGANNSTGPLEFTLEIPFPSEREASIAARSLSPDPEPRKGGISKALSVSDGGLSVKWTADEARILRVSVNSFLDHLALVLETMDEFGP